jgi:CheY-like chemotaxis protein
VVKATTGHEALKLLTEHKFDLLFLDLGMPEISGLEILNHVKLNKIDIEIVIITGYAEGAQIMSAAMEYGPLLIMRKPFSNEEILDVASKFTNKVS